MTRTSTNETIKYQDKHRTKQIRREYPKLFETVDILGTLNAEPPRLLVDKIIQFSKVYNVLGKAKHEVFAS
jgi:hypothetical protein